MPDIGRAAVEFGNLVDDRFAIAGHFAQVEGASVEGEKIDRLDHLDLGRKPGGVCCAVAPDHADRFDVKSFGIGGAVFVEPVFRNRFGLERIQGLAQECGVGLATHFAPEHETGGKVHRLGRGLVVVAAGKGTVSRSPGMARHGTEVA